MFSEKQQKTDLEFIDVIREDLLEIVEPTLHISNQDQFIEWTNTLLQRYFPHGKFVCGIGQVRNEGINVQYVIANGFPQEYLQTLKCSDGLTSSPILVKWIKEKQPILFESNSEKPHCLEIMISAPSGWLDNFNRFELVNVAAHGLFDTINQSASYFSFSNIPGSLTLRHAYLLKLLVPHLHSVLTRVVSYPQVNNHKPLQCQTKLTQREKEILQWLSSGKCSREVSQVAGLSEATVRNHVYNIMGKLQASTRAEAVAKAIHAKLIIN